MPTLKPHRTNIAWRHQLILNEAGDEICSNFVEVTILFERKVACDSNDSVNRNPVGQPFFQNLSDCRITTSRHEPLDLLNSAGKYRL